MKTGTRMITPYTMIVLDCIEEFYLKHGYPPTMREISNQMKGGSTSAIRYSMETLAERGFLTKGIDGQSRTQVPTFKPRHPENESAHG